MDQDSSTQNQIAINQRTTDRSRFRLVWIVYLFNTGYLFYYCFNNPHYVEYLRYVHENNDCFKLVDRCTETAKNKTLSVCYRKDEKITFPILINVLLGLVGTIIFSPVVHCLCEFIEKLIQSPESRKCQNVRQLLKSCFIGGILWGYWGGVCSFGLFLIIGLIAYFKATGISFNDGHKLFILNGCSISNLVTWWLRLDKQTPKEKQLQPSSDYEANASSNHKKNYLYPAYTLAWEYYFNHLKKVLTKFNRDFIDSIYTAVQDLGLGQDAQPKMWLNLKKMIILISPNCIAEHDLPLRNLHDLDNKIDFIRKVCKGGCSFSVYRLNYNGKQWTCVIEYVQKPLQTLKKMCCAENIKNLHEDQFEDQVQLFFSTLVSEILTRNSMSGNSCIPILTMAEPGSLENGGLVKIIMEKVEPNCTITRGKNWAPVTAATNSQTIRSHAMPMYILEKSLVEQSNSHEKTALLPSHEQVKIRRRPVGEIKGRRPTSCPLFRL